ncbi:MAG TPA: C40 family peptidase [Cytophagales bacterium]|nr:C40 family peptidase [Cytophagales bacterium]
MIIEKKHHKFYEIESIKGIKQEVSSEFPRTSNLIPRTYLQMKFNNKNNKTISTKRYYLYFMAFALSFSLYNCKSSKTTASRSDIQELDEDVFFDVDENEGEERKEPREKKKKVSKNDKVDKVIISARSYIGTPYKWGGMTRAGMDCSGLLVNCFRTVDIDLPRTSQAQSVYGKRVHIDDLEEGDLVFFATGRGKKVSHVGMVTDVRGRKDVRFIHASTSLGVIENNLFSPYYIKIFVKAVRPF